MNPLTPEQEVWLRAWCAVASSAACRQPSIAAGWATKCLEAYRKQFPPEKPKDPKPTIAEP